MLVAQHHGVADELLVELASLGPSMLDMVAGAAARRGRFAAVASLATATGSTPAASRSFASHAPSIRARLASVGQHLDK
jgi:hypothetical protein